MLNADLVIKIILNQKTPVNAGGFYINDFSILYI